MNSLLAYTRRKRPRTNMNLLDKFNNNLPEQLLEDECWDLRVKVGMEYYTMVRG